MSSELINENGISEDAMAEIDEPCDGDYMLSDCGSLGCMTAVSVVGGRFLGQFADEDDAMQFIHDRMADEQFWPNIWRVSDHGNVSLA